MRPEDLRASLRPRSVYEGIDLGYALARRHWRLIAKAWLAIVGPLYVIVWLVAASRPILALFLIWWLKPVWDRVPHYVLSRELFGQTPKLREIMRGLFSDGGLFWYLTLARFSWHRSFLMSVGALEGLHRSGGAKRKAVLARFGGGASFMLALVGWIIETIAFFGTTALVSVFVPDRPELHFDRMVDHLFASQPIGIYGWLLPIFYFVALSIAEPLYVAGGFGLYINRRAQLEGWDIELRFRRLAQRITRRQGVMAALLFALFVAIAPAPPATAQAALGEDPAEVIEEVLDREEFGGEVTHTRWVPRHRREREARELRGPRGGGLLAQGLGSLMELLLWLGLAIVVGYLVVLLARYLERRRPARRGHAKDERPRRVMAGRLSTPAPPPQLADDDVLRNARALWKAGQHADAVGLLYHGATQRLAPDGESLDAFTETDWVSYTETHLSAPRAKAFRELVDARVTTAYAHLEPQDDLFDLLAQQWRQSFARGSL